ncbi:hypothetical protein ACHAWF_013707 [Thalassiosira exigua]
MATDPHKVCGSSSCPNEGASTLADREKLQACGVCRGVSYCSKECQKSAWTREGHKYTCAERDVPRHRVDGSSLEDVQAAIDDAEPGDIVVLNKGAYRWKKPKSGDKLLISKPIRMWGPTEGGTDGGVTLHCNLEVNEDASNDGSVTVANLTILGMAKVQSNSYESVTFSRVKVHQTDPKADGTMVHIMRRGKCLFYRCELVGGDEVLYIDGIDDLAHSKEDNEDKVHVKLCTISDGGKRGICADDKFVLEKTVIKDNGWYGIRSNRGWTDKGGNEWQRNPAKPNQTPTSGNGMFDGIHIPVSGGSRTINVGGRDVPISFGQTAETMFPGFGRP